MSETATPAVETREAMNPLDAPDEEFLSDVGEAQARDDTAASGTPSDNAGGGQAPDDAAPATAGLTVDSAGRYHRPDGTMASADEIAAHKAKPETPAPSPEGVAASGTPAAATTDTAKPASEPFRFRADGQTVPVEGSSVDEQGNVTWPAQHVPQLRQWLAAGIAAAPVYEKLNQARAEVEQLKSQRTVSEAKAEAITGKFLDILNERDPAKAGPLLNEFWQTWPDTLAKAEVNYWKDQATRGAAQPATHGAPPQQGQPETAQPSGQQYPSLEIAKGSLTNALESYRVEHEFRGLTADDWKQIEARLGRNPYAFVRPATAEEAAQYGLTPGEIAFDYLALHAELTEYTTSQQRTSATAKKAAELAASNARRTTASVASPPTAGGSKPPPANPKGFTSKEDVDDYWESDEA